MIFRIQQRSQPHVASYVVEADGAWQIEEHFKSSKWLVTPVPVTSLAEAIRDDDARARARARCKHERLTEEGICRFCGADCRGIG
jgi:hypothetical protein